MKLTFIGLGKMGAAIVERLLKAGYEVTIFNRTKAKMTLLQEKGALISHSIGEAVQHATIILTSLFDDDSVLAVTKELLAYVRPGTIHVGLSTILPDTAEFLKDLHKTHQAEYVSAMILGIPSAVTAGNAILFCAGSESAIQTSMPLLQVFSKDVIPLGEKISAPNIMKICMNYSLMTAIELISELYIFAEKSGLNTDIVRLGLHQIYAHPSIKNYIEKIHARDFDSVNFDLRGGIKDVSLFQEAFYRVGVSPEIANITRARFVSALAHNMHDKDWSAISEIIRWESGCKI